MNFPAMNSTSESGLNDQPEQTKQSVEQTEEQSPKKNC
jgi:hypothetical protein